MVIETKEIGISLGVGNGTFVDTEYINGNLQLTQVSTTPTGESVYASNGYWESNPVDLVDKFNDYDKVVLTKTVFTQDFYEVLTRTSDDGITYDSYIAVAIDRTVQSPTRRFIQIKINLEAGSIEGELLISDFNETTDVNEWLNNSFVETDGKLKLKRNYQLGMTKDATWVDTGLLFRKLITRTEWKKIDSLNIQ